MADDTAVDFLTNFGYAVVICFAGVSIMRCQELYHKTVVRAGFSAADSSGRLYPRGLDKMAMVECLELELLPEFRYRK